MVQSSGKMYVKIQNIYTLSSVTSKARTPAPYEGCECTYKALQSQRGGVKPVTGDPPDILKHLEVCSPKSEYVWGGVREE